MYQSHGWWFPDADTHFRDMLTKSIKKGQGAHYQKAVRDASLLHVKNFGVALDIGANVGLWSRDLSERFDKVVAFEPVPDFRECFVLNVTGTNVEVRPCALGAEDTMIDMIVTPGNTGHSHVNTSSMGSGQIPMWRLDTLQLDRVDYVKIDCEGYELNILRGAEQTLRQHRPIVVVEQKFHTDTGITEDTRYGAMNLLLSWGARVLAQVRSDYVIGW
jgi:FkbM family methyltransferase